MLRKHLSTGGKRARVSRGKSAEIDRRIGKLCPDWAGSSQELAAQLNQEFQLNWDEEPYRKRAHKAGHTWPRTRDNDCIGCGQRFTSSNPNQKLCSGCRDDDRKCRCVPFQDIDQENYIICPYCKQEGGCPYCKQEGKYPPLRRISPQHLAVHGKNMEDLRREHPDAVITSTATRKANKARWDNATPKERRRHGKAIKKAVSAPEVKAKHSASMKQAQADPVKHGHIVAGVQRALADPEKVRRRVEGLRKKLRTRKVRRRFSAARKRNWQNPEVRAKYLKHINKMVIEREQKLVEAERIIALAGANGQGQAVADAPGQLGALKAETPKRGRPREDVIADQVIELKAYMAWPNLTKQMNREARSRGEEEKTEEAYRSLYRSRRKSASASSG